MNARVYEKCIYDFRKRMQEALDARHERQAKNVGSKRVWRWIFGWKAVNGLE